MHQRNKEPLLADVGPLQPIGLVLVPFTSALDLRSPKRISQMSTQLVSDRSKSNINNWVCGELVIRDVS